MARRVRSDRGTFRLTDKELIDRHSFVDAKSGCWVWVGQENTWGYGRLSRNRIERLAHRLAYRAFVGPIPDGLRVLHHCDNPACCNPSHLFIGTDADNMRDMATKGRCADRRGELAPNSKLTMDSVCSMRQEHANGARISDLARKYGVSRRTIGFAIRGETWSC
jgi:hypothetical protein